MCVEFHKLTKKQYLGYRLTCFKYTFEYYCPRSPSNICYHTSFHPDPNIRSIINDSYIGRELHWQLF